MSGTRSLSLRRSTSRGSLSRNDMTSSYTAQTCVEGGTSHHCQHDFNNRPRRRSSVQNLAVLASSSNSSSNLLASQQQQQQQQVATSNPKSMRKFPSWRQSSDSDISDDSSSASNSKPMHSTSDGRRKTSDNLGVRSSSSRSLFGSSSVGNNRSDLPSLRVVFSELLLVCSLYCRYAVHSVRQPCRRLRRILSWFFCSVAVLSVVLLTWMLLDFSNEAIQICTPPVEYEYPGARPLVEYYVHGRGIGHYARSVAIVDRLNEAGVDVRMFLTRAAMWRAIHEDSNDSVDNPTSTSKMVHDKMGTTTAISVASLSPKQNIFETISHVIERIIGDCEVSASSNHYPHLVISDGDFPGMLRAEFGGIPSVGIAHGQLFRIAQKPDWVEKVPTLNAAWNSQGRLNEVSSFFSKWQIATHFCFLESRVKSGVVARAPLRPEVLQMAVARTQAKDGKLFSYLPQLKRVKEVLQIQEDVSLERRKKHRKLVICYFRDHNGEMVVQALLDSGFDVLLFDSGYNKDLIHDPNRYGMNWVVPDHEQRLYNYALNTEVSIAVNTTTTGRSSRRHLREHLPYHDSTANDIYSRELRAKLQRDEVQDVAGPRLIRVMDRSLFVPLMHVADGVASSAGSQLMSECVYSHMPLLALYGEKDSEQKLNVELSRHKGPCHKLQVFGTSFEHLKGGLKAIQNRTTLFADFPMLEELGRFVREIQSSQVSQTFYQNHPKLGKVNSTENMNSQPDMDHKPIHEEDPFQNLPDAAEIILEIIKQVVQGS